MSVCEGSGELREEGSQNTRRVSGCPGFSVGERRSWRSVLVQSLPWLEGATGRRRATPCQHTRPRLCGVHGRADRREGGREGGSERETGRRTWWEWWVGWGGGERWGASRLPTCILPHLPSGCSDYFPKT